MKNKVFAVWDAKAKIFKSPFQMRTSGEALRGWQEIANDDKSEIGKHPMDFALMEIAEYDDETGQYINHQAPLNLGLADQYLKQKPNFGADK